MPNRAISPAPGQIWCSAVGAEYRILHVANQTGKTNTGQPVTIVFEGWRQGMVMTMPQKVWLKRLNLVSLDPVDRPLRERDAAPMATEALRERIIWSEARTCGAKPVRIDGRLYASKMQAYAVGKTVGVTGSYAWFLTALKKAPEPLSWTRLVEMDGERSRSRQEQNDKQRQVMKDKYAARRAAEAEELRLANEAYERNRQKRMEQRATQED